MTERDTRLAMLHEAIRRAPEAAVNYLLRGELYLDVGKLDPAQDDFATARRLAAAQAEASDWGYIARSYQDRAEQHLAALQSQGT